MQNNVWQVQTHEQNAIIKYSDDPSNLKHLLTRFLRSSKRQRVQVDIF